MRNSINNPLPLLIVFVFLMGMTAYLSLKSSPSLTQGFWLPHWLAKWGNNNGDIRTAVPFFFLSLLWPVVASNPKNASSIRSAISPRIGFTQLLLSGYAAIALFLVSTESLQLFIPSRFASIEDILWGMVGISSGGLGGLYLLKFLKGKGTSLT